MRTTITLPDDLVKRTLEATGKQHLSDAVIESLEDYLRLKKRLALLDRLYGDPVPHDAKQIKASRRARAWSS